jgi:hypothetical protein
MEATGKLVTACPVAAAVVGSMAVPTITGISPPSITESPQLSGIGVSSLTSAD